MWSQHLEWNSLTRRLGHWGKLYGTPSPVTHDGCILGPLEVMKHWVVPSHRATQNGAQAKIQELPTSRIFHLIIF